MLQRHYPHLEWPTVMRCAVRRFFDDEYYIVVCMISTQIDRHAGDQPVLHGHRPMPPPHPPSEPPTPRTPRLPRPKTPHYSRTPRAQYQGNQVSVMELEAHSETCLHVIPQYSETCLQGPLNNPFITDSLTWERYGIVLTKCLLIRGYTFIRVTPENRFYCIWDKVTWHERCPLFCRFLNIGKICRKLFLERGVLEWKL